MVIFFFCIAAMVFGLYSEEEVSFSAFYLSLMELEYKN